MEVHNHKVAVKQEWIRRITLKLSYKDDLWFQQNHLTLYIGHSRPLLAQPWAGCLMHQSLSLLHNSN